MQRVLITGVNGFLGSNLAEAFCKSYKVIGLKRSTSNISRILNFPLKLYDTDKTPLMDIFIKHKPNIILHTAGCLGRNNEPLSHIVETNLLFSLKLLECAKNFNIDIFFNADTLQNDYFSNYTISKKTLRDYLPNFIEYFKIINCRIEHIYGFNDDGNKFVPSMLKSFNQNIPNIPLTKGEQLRDFIYIKDVVSAYLLLLNNANIIFRSSNFASFDIATGNLVKLKDFCIALLDEFRKYKNTISRLDFGKVPYAKNEAMKINEDITPLFNLGFRPKYNYKNGIKDLLYKAMGGGYSKLASLVG
ncbi:NAD(P)-dependent oxidoreductase [Helicobacter sp. MIT 14-3879]|uniref:NAD-dependent epimerase/dehydratase family protein n=1 Tax=Helicobacter sp. MIT 14-3879 TaxID=2040649 RepID=UPI000E1F5561|nr:NAD(P)-dependent oxidoreductase [Helicobacter sp. MIT 14-3879]RDU61717.1 NAD(P)-dependent oxidoreductase [Helicobacter sp. MIT 14-3879]